MMLWKEYSNILLKSKIDREFSLVSKLMRKYPALRKRFHLASKLPIGGKVLDIGAGTGRSFLFILSSLRPDLELHAVDIEENLMTVLKDKVRFLKADVNRDELSFDDNYFDLIASIYVLEHLTNPVNRVQQSYRLLKKDGYLFLETAHAKSILLCFPRFLARGNGYLNFFDDPTHIRPYTEASLLNLANMAGFEDIESFIIRDAIYTIGLPYSFIRYLTTLNREWLSAFLDPIIGTKVACIAKKEPLQQN